MIHSLGKRLHIRLLLPILMSIGILWEDMKDRIKQNMYHGLWAVPKMPRINTVLCIS